MATAAQQAAWRAKVKAKQRALDILRREAISGDIEAAHGNADDALCDYLRALGHHDIVDAFDKVEKWYA